MTQVAGAVPRLSDDGGAILVQVATVLLVFTMLSAFVVDYGIQVIGRTQIQTAVDAAALAGATALAYDSYTDRSATGPAYTTAEAVAAENLVWKRSASVDVDPNVVCESTWAVESSNPPLIRACVRVNATRTAIPTLFAQLMGVTSFGVAATAIGEAKDANATGCLKPIAIPDRWLETSPPWNAASTFARYDPANPANLLPDADGYVPPAPDEAGDGLTITVDFGTQATLTQGSLTAPIATISPWQYLPVQIPGSVWGADAVRSNTEFCAASRVFIGDRGVNPTRLNIATGAIPANADAIAAGLTALIGRDPDATWNPATQRVEESCADPPVRCASMSPRIIALPVYDPIDLADASRAGGATSVLMTNIAGFFVETVVGTNVTGRIVRHPGVRDDRGIILTDASSFLRASLLVK